MAKIGWSEEGLKRFRQILEYIEEDSPQNAAKLATTIWNRIQQLKEFPELGRIVPEFDRKEIREVIVYNFRIVYRLKTQDKIEIVGVHHSAQILPHIN
jgi:plasmid stabilization system protein ParE